MGTVHCWLRLCRHQPPVLELEDRKGRPSTKVPERRREGLCSPRGTVLGHRSKPQVCLMTFKCHQFPSEALFNLFIFSYRPASFDTILDTLVKMRAEQRGMTAALRVCWRHVCRRRTIIGMNGNPVCCFRLRDCSRGWMRRSGNSSRTESITVHMKVDRTRKVKAMTRIV